MSHSTAGPAAPAHDPARLSDTSEHGVVCKAKRRALNSREPSPSGGVYAAYEQNWWLFQHELKKWGVVPKPGDVVIDDEDNRHTVQTVQYGKLRNSWRCTTINLVLAYDLRDKVIIERARVTYDTAGAAVQLFPSGPGPRGGIVLYGEVPARIQLLTEEIEEQRGIRGPEERYEVTVGQQLEVRPGEDRVLWAATGLYLDITGYRNPERLDELPKLDCLKKV